MKNPFVPKDNTTFSNPDHQSAGILDDYAVRKSVQSQEINTNVSNHSIIILPDAVSIVPNINAANIFLHNNTQGAGNFNINNPTGTPQDGQALIIRIKSTAVQTYVWDTLYRGGTTDLPTNSSGSSKTDYIAFMYNSTSTKWDLVGLSPNH